MTGQTTPLPDHPLDWRETDHGAVPVSLRFDDPFYSLQGGLAETRHVFLAGNGLPDRLRDGFHVAELGFGTGLNFLTTLQAFRDAGVAGRLRFTSFEAYPLGPAALSRALAPFASDLPTALLTQVGDLTGPDFDLAIVAGDAGQTLPRWDGVADAWFLDGFSPARNPGLWTPQIIASVGAHTAADGTAATYSAAGHVRQSLAEAGFAVSRVPGFGAKRHMTIARKAA
ncbi:tRNA (5-methylaminomethyl-2-thiouridine)(34)-methyltransferase MnmD [Loktanella sp. DJP18]|uniref:tRNA (5-methylaminomethyl-2-thiouridine)(34)-methyltransferase MnmD n=1 Tax=Loktanella sp. DJP18 TaxID=3409788 RepID=UPI003BB5A1AA